MKIDGLAGGSMKAVIDRIEGDWIVFVDDEERTFEIPLEYCAEAEEGDHVDIVLTKDTSAQEEAEKRIEDLRSKLRRVPSSLDLE